MKVEIKLDELGLGMSQATVVYWLSDIGDFVFKDQPIVELSCDKEIFTLLSPAEGIIEETSFRAGDGVGIGNILGIIETDPKLFKPA